MLSIGIEGHFQPALTFACLWVMLSLSCTGESDAGCARLVRAWFASSGCFHLLVCGWCAAFGIVVVGPSPEGHEVFHPNPRTGRDLRLAISGYLLSTVGGLQLFDLIPSGRSIFDVNFLVHPNCKPQPRPPLRRQPGYKHPQVHHSSPALTTTATTI